MLKTLMKRFIQTMAFTTLVSFLVWPNLASAADPVQPFSPEKESKLIEMLNKAAKKERNPVLIYLLLDQFEVSDQSENPLSWDATAWIGTDAHKIYFNTEGEAISGKTDSENQLLYSHPILPFWDVQMGLSYDKTADSFNQTWATIGIQGLAPYFFDTSTYLLTNGNNTGIRFDGEFDFLFTQRLIFTPQIKLNVYTQDQPKFGLGSGLSDTEVGLRLRYEFSRKFAPYVGIKWQKSYGKTADFLTLSGGDSSEISLVAGFRIWY